MTGAVPLDSTGVIEPPSARDAFGLLGRTAAARPFRMTGAFVLLLAGAALGLCVPLAVGWIVDAMTGGGSSAVVIVAAGFLVVSAVLRGLTEIGGERMLLQITQPALAELREEAFQSAFAGGSERIEASGSGDLLARLTADIERLAEAAETTIAAFASSALTLLVTLAGLAALDWRFALAGLVAVPIQVVTLRWYLRQSGPVYRAARVADGARATRLLDLFHGLDTLRGFGLGRMQRRAVETASLEAMELEQQSVRFSTRFYGRLNVAEFCGLAAILLTGFVLASTQSASIGAVTTAALFFVALFDPINTVLGLFGTVQQAAASLTRVVAVIRLPRAVDSAATAPAAVRGTVDLQSVHATFGQGRPDAVAEVTLRIEEGERIAVVGASGAGKSTLARLIAGTLSASSGMVRIGGVDVRELAGPERRSSVVLLDQRTHVFSGALRDDVLLAAPSASDAEIHAAFEIAGASGLLASLPDGLDTVVGAGGHPLTAADAQHVALVRLVLLDPRVAILDEATADAGSAAARALEAATSRVLRGRTGIVIAHRLTQAVDADRVVVLDAGRVVEQGSHRELVAAGGRYAELWAAWSSSRVSS